MSRNVDNKPRKKPLHCNFLVANREYAYLLSRRISSNPCSLGIFAISHLQARERKRETSRTALGLEQDETQRNEDRRG